MISLQDRIYSLVPSHVNENHPRFVEFLKAYYTWLSQEGNPYSAIKNHMDYMNFKKSMDSYTDALKKEYLPNVPEDVLIDKELFIKWSKKFNMARGSHDSYRFLFNILFNEDGVEIYLPKKNILRTSDGTWSSGENIMLVTNSSNSNNFLYQRIVQKRPITDEIFEYAYATVQKVKTKYVGKYILTELSISDISGEFKEGFSIENETGISEWPIPTVSRVDVAVDGEGYEEGQRIQFEEFDRYNIRLEATEEGVFDTRVTTLMKAEDVSVSLNGSSMAEYEFDGRYVSSEKINVGDIVDVSFPSFPGYYAIDEVDSEGSIRTINLLEASVGCPEDDGMFVDGQGEGAVVRFQKGVLKPESGRFLDEKGWLSSNMYLQDSSYYQEYSYVIKTQQNIDSYGQVVKDLLHPAGFAMFGNLSIVEIIELVIKVIGFSLEKKNKKVESTSMYGLGNNYGFIDRFKGGMSKRLYRFYNFEEYDIRMAVGDPKYGKGNPLYDYNGMFRGLLDLENSLTSNYIDFGYFEFDYIDSVPDKTTLLKGWMTKDQFTDYYLYIPQDYVQEEEPGNLYMETGYVSPRSK